MALAAPPCGAFSLSRLKPGGPPPVRTPEFPDGLSGLRPDQVSELQLSLRNCTIWRVSSLRWCLCVEASFCLRIQRPALLGKPKGLMRGCGSLRLILPTWRPVPTESMLSRAGFSAATTRISCAWRLCALTLKARIHLCLESVRLTGRFLLALRLCILSPLPMPLLTLSNLHCLRVVSSCRSCSGCGFCQLVPLSPSPKIGSKMVAARVVLPPGWCHRSLIPFQACARSGAIPCAPLDFFHKSSKDWALWTRPLRCLIPSCNPFCLDLGDGWECPRKPSGTRAWKSPLVSRFGSIFGASWQRSPRIPTRNSRIAGVWSRAGGSLLSSTVLCNGSWPSSACRSSASGVLHICMAVGSAGLGHCGRTLARGTQARMDQRGPWRPTLSSCAIPALRGGKAGLSQGNRQASSTCGR